MNAHPASEPQTPRFPPGWDEQRLIAAVDLVGRTGAAGFDFGYLHDDVRIEDADWWARATYRGAQVVEEHHVGPIEAAEALARRLLVGGLCTRCGAVITLSDQPAAGTPLCRWRREGPRWRPGCEMAPRRSGKARRKRGKR